MKRTMMVLGFLGVSAASASAQAPTTLSGDLAKTIGEVETKLTGLGQAMTAAQYDWRPGAGVRSVGEVLLHVAADNYFLPVMLGVAAPAATKITGEYPTVQAYEQQKLSREATLAEVTASFAHLKAALAGVPESRMNETIRVFGQEFTVRGFLVLTATHLHEHLGQMIAYARSNGVTPPWSR
ncbi:MAG TPA: DinB family protein [Longimicrobiales bacterium]|nr:DinB family protein [Longimicrobiales bacterium]